MTQFMMMRINYDDRAHLQPQKKYSIVATKAEHQRIIDRYERREPHIGGWGFHECLNFARAPDGHVRIYLPPSCIPGEDRLEDDFVIFSFTYSSDPVQPNRIIGVQGGVVISNEAGVVNPAAGGKGNVELSYHGVGPHDLSTLFVPPLQWVRDEGRFLPRNVDWRMGRKYFDGVFYPSAILDAAREQADQGLRNASSSTKAFLKRQIEVIDRIKDRYFVGIDSNPAEDVAEVKADSTISETESKVLVDARMGQGKFRARLDRRWNSSCAVTGCDVREALRASHIKAWKLSSHKERLDGRNGLLLIATLDALFDKHLISFTDDGEMLVGRLSAKQKKLLGLPKRLRMQLNKGELDYLRFHRDAFNAKLNA